MISPRKLHANRANSLRSTGPKTAAGRATAARNARRHGLRIPVLSDPALSAEVEALAQKIAGNGSPELLELARKIAEAEIDVIRVRRARTDLISRIDSDLRDQTSVDPGFSDRLADAILDRAMKIAANEQVGSARIEGAVQASVRRVGPIDGGIGIPDAVAPNRTRVCNHRPL